MNADEYLEALAAQTRGSAPERLLAELRDHLDDAARDGDARAATELLGTPQVVASAWRDHVRRRRAQTRRRAALLTLTVATAASLAVAQHASGHRQLHQPCAGRPHAACPAPAAGRSG